MYVMRDRGFAVGRIGEFRQRQSNLAYWLGHGDNQGARGRRERDGKQAMTRTAVTQ